MINNSPNVALVDMKELIFEFLNASGKDRSDYARTYPIAMRGVKDLAIDVFLQPIECKLRVENNMTAKLPEDCMKLIDVGILNESGQFASLKYDGDMSLVYDTSNTRTADNKDSQTYDLFNLYQQFFLNYYYIYPYNNLYGAPGGLLYLGAYKVDYNNNVILLNNDYSYGYVVLKYLRWDCAQNVRIPQDCVESFLAWLDWQSIAHMPLSSKVSINDRELKKRDYYRLKKLAAVRMNGFSLEKANDVERESVRLCVKS